MLKACIIFRQVFTGQLIYNSLAANDIDQDWMTDHITEWFQNRFLSGELEIRGADPLPVEMPASLVEAALERPQLRVCVCVCGKKG